MSKLSELFQEEAKDLSEERKVNLDTLIVPYLDVTQDGNEDTASLKWVILGTYSKKDTEFLQSLLVDYQENVGPLDNSNLAEFIKKAHENNKIELEVISYSDMPTALQDLVVWNGEIETESEAIEWLIGRGYEIGNYKKEINNLYEEITSDPATPLESIEHSKTLESKEDALIWLVKDRKKIHVEEEKPSDKTQQPTDIDSPEWDDENWDDTGIVRLMRSAAVQKNDEIKEYKKSTIKELISDGPIAASMATGSVPAMVLTGLGITIASLIYKAKTDTEKEFLEILDALSRFKENRQSPDKHEQAKDILKQDVARLNIKLSGVKPVSRQKFKKEYPELLERAKKEGFIKDPKRSAQKVEEASNNLLHIKNTKSIAQKLAISIKNGGIETWSNLVDSIKEWKDPVALASGTLKGFKAEYINIVDALNISDVNKKHKKSEIAIERAENKIIKIKNEGHQQELPVAEILHTQVDLQDLDASKAAHKNIEIYKKRQPLNHVNFALATSLTSYAGYDLVDKAIDLVKTYSHDPSMLQQGQEMLQNAVTDNWIGVLSNSWGILFGGIAALSATGKKLHHDTTALRSEFAQVDKNLASVVKLEESINEIMAKQIEKKKPKNESQPTNE